MCVHGAGGESIFPLRLSNLMETKRPIVTFRATGLSPGESPLNSAEEMAANYITAARMSGQPRPYVLLGHCAGCSIVYEMAQRLTSLGEPPSCLILIDPESNRAVAPYLYDSTRLWSKIYLRLYRLAKQTKWWIRIRRSASGDKLRAAVTYGIMYASGDYVPKPYHGRTLLFCSTGRRERLLDPERGYQTLLTDLEIIDIPFEHTKMFKFGLKNIVAGIESFTNRGLDPKRATVKKQ